MKINVFRFLNDIIREDLMSLCQCLSFWQLMNKYFATHSKIFIDLGANNTRWLYLTQKRAFYDSSQSFTYYAIHSTHI
jgi:hypothetical protein